MTIKNSHTLIIDTPPDTLDAVHDLLRAVWEKSPDVDVSDQIRFETALIELASNIFRHADSGKGVSCALSIDISPQSIEANLKDTGEPGDIELVNLSMPEEFAESGRGLALIRALVDEFTYERVDDHNFWRIARRRVSQ
jgi:serine/threonine-protein kinase RsbW